MTAEHAPGWYPDPTRRHEQRWYDGDRWTSAVSTSGTVADDPQGVQAPTPDFTMLDAASLAIDFAQTGMVRNGYWMVHDRAAGREVGAIGVNLGKRFDRASCVGLDVAGHRLFEAEQPSRSVLVFVVRDHQGRPVGRLALRAPSVLLLAPATADPEAPEVVWATSQPSPTPAGVRDNAFWHLQLRHHDGTPLGGLHIDEGSTGFFGTKVSPSWFHLDRAAPLPDPLRTLTLALVPFFATYTKKARDAAAARNASQNRSMS